MSGSDGTESADRAPDPRRWLVVSNASAGGNDDDAVATAVREWKRAGCEVQVAETGGHDELCDVVRDVSHDTVVVAAGGDGSIHAVVEALSAVGRLDEVTVGLLALGTGNDFARGLGLSLDPGEAARAMVRAPSRRMDLLVDGDGMVGVNAVNLGIGAAASQRASSLKDGLGKAAYPLGAVAAGATQPGWTLTISVDGTILVDGRPVLHVVVANGPSIGGGTMAAPAADPADAQLDVMVSLATGPMARVDYATDLQAGTHVDRDDVLVATGRTVRIDGDEHPWNVDGELPPPRRSSHWTLQPGAWHMLVAD